MFGGVLSCLVLSEPEVSPFLVPTLIDQPIASIGSRIANVRSLLSALNGVMYKSCIPFLCCCSDSIRAMGPITAARVLPDPVGTCIRPLSPCR